MTLGSAGRIWFVGIFCDSCGRQEAGDVAASGQGAAEDGLRAELVAGKGWSCDAAGDLCARCRPAAAELVTGSAGVGGDVAPAPGVAVVATAAGTVSSTGTGGGGVGGPGPVDVGAEVDVDVLISVARAVLAEADEAMQIRVGEPDGELRVVLGWPVLEALRRAIG